MKNWIQEHSYSDDEQYDTSRWKLSKDFFQLLSKIPEENNSIMEISESIMESSNLDEQFLSALELKHSQDNINSDMLLTLGCAFALANNPNVDAWKKIRMISNNSWKIEHWLKEAMLAYAKFNPSYKNIYVKLVEDIIFALDNGDLLSESERKNIERDNFWNYWEANDNQLQDLFDGLRLSNFMNYEEEMRLFGVLSNLSPYRFQLSLSNIKNPFLLDCVFLGTEIGVFNPKYTEWSLLVNNAPTAFNADGSWTGSILIPLLLTQGRNHLLYPARHLPRNDADMEMVLKITEQTSELVTNVIEVVGNRVDGQALLARWGIWIIKQLINERIKEFNDVRADDFVDYALLIAIGKKIQGKTFDKIPSDAALWEDWCLYCIKILFASEGFSNIPNFEQIASYWEFTIDEWHKDKGYQLLQLSELHIPRDIMPNLSARLFAYALSQQPNFAIRWRSLWNKSLVLRDILEFGSTDSDKNAYSDKGDASNRLLLLACIGMACLDQCVECFLEEKDINRDDISSLYQDLSNALIEILYIDNTIHRDKWKYLLRSLALRRILWDQYFIGSLNRKVFTEHNQPNPIFWLNYLGSDSWELITYIYDCLKSGVEKEKMLEILADSSVNLNYAIQSQNRLNKLREFHYKFNSHIVNEVEKLIDMCRTVG